MDQLAEHFASTLNLRVNDQVRDWVKAGRSAVIAEYIRNGDSHEDAIRKVTKRDILRKAKYFYQLEQEEEQEKQQEKQQEKEQKKVVNPTQEDVDMEDAPKAKIIKSPAFTPKTQPQNPQRVKALLQFKFQSPQEEQDFGRSLCSHMKDGLSYQEASTKAATHIAKRPIQPKKDEEMDDLVDSMSSLKARPLKRKKRPPQWGSGNPVDKYIDSIAEEVAKEKVKISKTKLNHLVGYEICLGLNVHQSLSKAIDFAMSAKTRKDIVNRAIDRIGKRPQTDAFDFQDISDQAKVIVKAHDERMDIDPRHSKRSRLGNYKEMDTELTNIQLGRGKKKKTKQLFDFFDL